MTETTVPYRTETTGSTTPLTPPTLAHGDITELLDVVGRVLEVLEDPRLPYPLRYRACERAGELRNVLCRLRAPGSGVSP